MFESMRLAPLPAPGGWGYPALAGQITELTAHGPSGMLTVAVRLVHEAQTLGEPVAWITERARHLYPPDVAANGVDLAALAVVRLADPADMGRAADTLVRSGAFGLVVIDMAARGKLAEKHLIRLLGLARKHGTAIVCLVQKPDALPSLGAAVSLRAAVRRERVRAGPGEDDGEGPFRCVVEVLKDRRRPSGWQHAVRCAGPAGLA